MSKTLMKLNDQPAAVQQLFRSIDGSGRFALEPLKTRIRLLFDGEVLGGWADDRGNGQHWYVLENPQTVGLHPSYKYILDHFRFCRTPQTIKCETRHYWLTKGSGRMWLFKRAIEEITGVSMH